MPCVADCGACCINIVSAHPSRFEEYIDMTGDDLEKYAVNIKTANFVYDNWTVTKVRKDEATYECLAYDRLTRSCTAHDSRPPVCSEYPWYDKNPDKNSASGKSMHNLCGYMEDIRTVLPIVQINGVDKF